MKASIIIATDGQKPDLWRTLDSIRLHTAGSDFEVVIADRSDGAAARRFLNFSDDVRWTGRTLRVDARDCSSHGDALNRAADASSGSILVFLDAHVAVETGWLAALRASLERGGLDCALVPRDCPLDEIGWTTGPGRSSVMSLDETLWYRRVVPDADRTLVCTSSGSCLALPRRLFESCGGFDTCLLSGRAEYIDLVFRLAAAGLGTHLEPGVELGYSEPGRTGAARSDPSLLQDRLRIGQRFLPAPAFARMVSVLKSRPGADADLIEQSGEHARDDCTDSIASSLPSDFVARFLPMLLEPPGQQAQASDVGDRGEVGRLRVAFNGATVEVSTTVGDVLRQTSRRFGRLVVAEAPVVDSRLEVRDDGHGYTMYVDGAAAMTGLDARSAARAVHHEIIRVIARLSTKHLWIHAGAVGRSSDAILLLGPFGCGKSTLVRAFCEQGWEYFSDDIVPVELESRSVAPFPIMPFVRNSVGEDKGRRFRVTNLDVLPCDVAAEKASLRAILLPQHRQGAQLLVSEGSRSEAILQLAHHALRRRRDPRAALEEFTSVVGQLPVLRVEYGDATVAVPEIASRLSPVFGNAGARTT